MNRQERSDYDRKYYQKHRAKILLRHNTWYFNNRASELVRRAAYRDANREAINLSQKTDLTVSVCRQMLREEAAKT